ncbi:uncharacterized protein LOC114296256 [Camellia sinensis]|uniref:uncharacterized protein LOC114296256 n=1 Tax=Camellia sinensis TaxID=4442 RepID=UPI0010365792|nr:uncharacterized protein LOC114296256 [Camellia sinensis]
MTGQTRFGVKDKLAQRYVGPYEILEKINPVTYRVALPPIMEHMHGVFHVSMLRDYLRDPLHVIEPTHVLLKDDYTYEDRPIQIFKATMDIDSNNNSFNESKEVEEQENNPSLNENDEVEEPNKEMYFTSK